MLKKAGLWENALYLERKNELGIFIEDVREVLPNCVVADVRKRWLMSARGGPIPLIFHTRGMPHHYSSANHSPYAAM